MNRYVRDGLLADMRAGRKVILIAENGRHARQCLETLAAMSLPSERVRRSSGEEEITNPTAGGRIGIFTRRSQAFRGVLADVVFVDADVMPGELAVITPCAAGGGELILR